MAAAQTASHMRENNKSYSVVFQQLYETATSTLITGYRMRRARAHLPVITLD